MREYGTDMVQDIEATLPRAFISVEVGLEMSSHHDGQGPFSGSTALSGTRLGICCRGRLFGSRFLPFPALFLSRPWTIGGVCGTPSIRMVGMLMFLWKARSGWRSFSDKRSAHWTRFRTTGSKCVLRTPCSSYSRAASDRDGRDVRSCGGTYREKPRGILLVSCLAFNLARISLSERAL